MTAKDQGRGGTAASRLDAVVAGLQEAALDEKRWGAVSTQIDDAAGTFASHLVVLSNSGSVPDFLFSRGLLRGEPCEEIERIYLEDYALLDERVHRTDWLPLGRPLHNTDIFTEAEKRSSPVYCDFLPRFGSNNQVCVRLEGLHGTDIVWTLSAQPTRDWTSEQIGFIQRLLPHVRHFVHVRQTLAAAEAREVSLAGLLERSWLAVLHLDRSGRVLESNGTGRRLLTAGHHLKERGGMLRARWPGDDARLGRLLSVCCRDGVGGSMAVRSADLGSATSSLVLYACPVPRDLTSWDTRAVAAQVLLTEPEAGPAVDPRLVAEAYDLTRTESEVAALLAKGRTVGEIAVSKGCKETTVRWHVRNLHSKLGVHRQTDLVRLVLATTVGTTQFTAEGASGSARD